jgi:DNA polymerase-4
MSLFDKNAEKLNLYRAVDDIKDRFGAKAVTKAVTSKLTKGGNKHTTGHSKKKEAE